uniref:Putative peptidase n=1 Tax=viral metagenome TaxID=1070528 RepID=A0A6M3L1P0_9ZZZZ
MSIYASKNFKFIEFVCPCGCGIDRPIDVHYIYLLQSLRDYVNQPVYITKGGGIRCLAYNKDIGGYWNSAHLFHKAGDIRSPGISVIELAKLAKQIGFSRVGIYPYTGHVHTDVFRPVPSEAWARGKGGRYYYYKKFEDAIEAVSKW